MAEFKINVDLSGLIQQQQVITAQVMPMLNQAVRAVAQQATSNWIEAVRRAKLWSGEKDAYAATIRFEMTGDFSAVVMSDYKHAEEIETGRPARDLKKMLGTSLKVRLTSKGSRYLIIPFRHGTPGNNAHGPSMPQHVHDIAKDLKPSKVTGQKQRLSGTGAMDTKTKKYLTVNQNTYSWGGRLPAGSMGPNMKGKSDRFAGMVKFDTSTPGGAKSSSYMTFRVMSENSKGWIIPPQPGLHLAENVAKEMQPMAERVFQEAVKRTLG